MEESLPTGWKSRTGRRGVFYSCGRHSQFAFPTASEDLMRTCDEQFAERAKDERSLGTLRLCDVDSVLDLGCGAGTSLCVPAWHVGVDASLSALHAFRSGGPKSTKRVAICADLECMPESLGAPVRDFDLVCACFVSEQVDVAFLIVLAGEYVREGGRFALTLHREGDWCLDGVLEGLGEGWRLQSMYRDVLAWSTGTASREDAPYAFGVFVRDAVL